MGQNTPERITSWELDAGGRRVQQTVVATVGATGPPAGANALEASAASPLGTQVYSYNERDQLTQTSGTGTSTSYTYDANGNRLTQTETKGASNKTTSYRWNAQDQLVRIEQGIGTGASLQTLASYRYNADNLRAEKALTDNGIANATQGSTAISDPLAYERIQWDGLHARRSFEITGANNSTQTLRSDTDAAVLQGNTAPWLFNRTNYANGVGSASSTTQLLSDSNGNLTATVVNDAGAAKADSLLVYSAYGAVDTEASGNAGTGLRSNANTFGSYYADPETGLLYARARYFDPASGQFISRDSQEGEANLPITWGAYQYGRYNPYSFTDPNGKCDQNSTVKGCAIEMAGGLTGAIGLTAVKTVESTYELGAGVVNATIGTLKWSADGWGEILGFEESQRRNRERFNTTVGIIGNIDKVPGALYSSLKNSVVNFDDEARREDADGNPFTGAMLRGSQAAGVAMAIGSLPQAIKTLAGLAELAVNVGKDAARPVVAGVAQGVDRVAAARAAAQTARQLEKVEPVLAAQTKNVGAAGVRAEVNSTTRVMAKEGNTLANEGIVQSATNTADATVSKAACCSVSGISDATETLYRVGKPATSLERSFEHALSPQMYVEDVAKHYKIKLKGSGQKIQVVFDETLASGRLGVTYAAEGGRVIRVGPDALVDQATAANTIAHELSHARDYLRGALISLTVMTTLLRIERLTDRVMLFKNGWKAYDENFFKLLEWGSR